MQPTAGHIDYQLLYEDLQVKYTDVLHQLEQLKKMIFGSKSERYIPADSDQNNPQLSLALDAETIAACKITEATKVEYIRTKTEVAPNKPKTHPGRMKL